jgi:hypothetical protein
MGKGNSGKKSPAVMIFFFSAGHAGAANIMKESKQIQKIVYLFISDCRGLWIVQKSTER